MADLTDDQVNATTAKSWGAAPQPYDEATAGGLPCIQVAGVTVWLYRKDGTMQISIDTDDMDQNTPTVTNEYDQDLVPMVVSVNGADVWAEGMS